MGACLFKMTDGLKQPVSVLSWKLQCMNYINASIEKVLAGVTAVNMCGVYFESVPMTMFKVRKVMVDPNEWSCSLAFRNFEKLKDNEFVN